RLDRYPAIPPDSRTTTGRGARGAGTSARSQRQPRDPALRAGPAPGAGDAHPGSVRPARHPPRRRRPGARAAALAGAELSSAAGDRRPGELLGEHVSAGAQGAARPLSETRLAGRPVDRDGGTAAATETLRRLAAAHQ